MSLSRYSSKIKEFVKSMPFFCLTYRRKAHLYCVGAAKSGTHSIAALFEDGFRSVHEPENQQVIDLIMSYKAGKIGDKSVCRFLIRRDRRLCLDVDSSQLNIFFIDKLVKLFPKSKFIFTIRNPYDWLDSFINHQLSRNCSASWKKWRDWRFRPDKYSFSEKESVLKQKGLYTLDGYLSYWAYHNLKVIETVPDDRLLVIKTDEISQSVGKIAAFAKIAESDLNSERSFVYKAKGKFYILNEIDKEYLEYKIKQHCGFLLEKFFPGIL